MKKLKNKFSLSELMLVSSGKPCKNRTQGGGHAVVYLPEEEVESIVLDIFELSDPLASTSTVSLVNARVGQGKFRKNVIDSWGNDEVCALTGITTKPLLVASHIKPFGLSVRAMQKDWMEQMGSYWLPILINYLTPISLHSRKRIVAFSWFRLFVWKIRL
ncbi:hypothetical protein [Vibrio cyclitrophicus]|uniref:hypothetical protein n=1 Tax=Vibrio cyclitrophicus TaxID=47951 RepID=UPI0038B38A87